MLKINPNKVLITYIILFFSWQILNPIPIFNIYFVYIASILLLFINNRKLSNSQVINILWPTMIYLIFAIGIFYICNISPRYWNTIDNYFKIQSIVILSITCVNSEEKTRRKYLELALWGWFFTTISTLINVLIDPAILRNSASSQISSAIFWGLGGFDFVYGSIVVNCLLLYLLLNKIQVGRKLFYIVFLVVSNLMILISGYSTATILNVLFEGVIVILKVNKIHIKIALIVLVIVVSININNIVSILSNMGLIHTITMDRINSILNNFEIADNVNTFIDGVYYDRFVRTNRSIEMFLEHPLIGNFLTEKGVLTGEHTEWIDRLAQYGAIIFSFIALFWGKMFSYTKKSAVDSGYKSSIVWIVYLYFVILGFFNPCTYMLIVYPIVMILPLMLSVFRKDELL